jgi:hypothetical protein
MMHHMEFRLGEEVSALSEGPSATRVDRVFRGLRAHWLRQYAAGADLSMTLRHGAYNCVSGTALMAWAFTRLGMAVDIREQSSHVYLHVHDGAVRYRIETTESDFGAIREKLKAQPRRPDERSISLRQLVGLQYYNAALLALDRQAPDLALQQLQNATHWYGCGRIAEMRAHARNLVVERGLQALASGDWQSALAQLDLAASDTTPGGSLLLGLAASVLSAAEHAPNLSTSQALLMQHGRRYPALFSQADFAASCAEATLLLAQASLLAKPSDLGVHALLVEFEAWHQQHAFPVDAQLAASVYRAAFLQALRYQDMGRAEACLRMGLQLAPMDSDLISGKMALLD